MCLTHRSLNKIIAIWQTIFLCIFLNEKYYILSEISVKFVPEGPIDNKSALLQVMVWCLFTITWTNDDTVFWQHIDGFMQCSKLNPKSCQSCCLESQILNIKLKKSLKKVPGPPPKLSASGWRTGSNLEHWFMQERHNSIVNALELCLFCTNPSIWHHWTVTS